ncbi:MAG: DoxX family protein [Acidobacteriota bacterium]|nr:DoxX family protein [Acidobacteriota bacterium]
MQEKTKNIVTWVVSGLVGAAFLMSGSFKVIGDPNAAAENFASFGLPSGMALFIGICEMAGGVGVLVPRLAGLAASGLIVIMLGAVYNHLVHTPPAQALPPLILGLLCGFVVYSRGLAFGKAGGAA